MKEPKMSNAIREELLSSFGEKHGLMREIIEQELRYARLESEMALKRVEFCESVISRMEREMADNLEDDELLTFYGNK